LPHGPQSAPDTPKLVVYPRLSGLARIADLVRRVAVTQDGHRVIIFGFFPQISKTKAVAVAFIAT
jgi:hypothetical protein